MKAAHRPVILRPGVGALIPGMEKSEPFVIRPSASSVLVPPCISGPIGIQLEPG